MFIRILILLKFLKYLIHPPWVAIPGQQLVLERLLWFFRVKDLMADPFDCLLGEWYSTIRFSFFNGTNNTYWKTRIKIFIQAQDYNMWNVILNGPHTPIIIVNNMYVPKFEKDWNVNDKKMAQLNAKAINIIYCSLDMHKFNRISTCILAKKIWDKLEVTHEETSQVKKSKINLLIHKYKIFKIKPHESISDMFIRFMNITNVLNDFGKIYTNHELVCKILRSLPKK